MIATAIRNGRSSSTWKNRSTFNDEGRYPTTEFDNNRSIRIIMHRQHLPSLKIWKRSNKKRGRNRGPKMGFQIADNSYAQMNGEDAERWQRKLAVQTRAFSSYCSSQWVSQRDLSPLQAPKPLGLESQVLHVQVALGDGYLLNPKWRRYGQNWRHIVG